MPDSVLTQQIVDNMPREWRGTTFRNSNLLGREKFSQGLNALLDSHSAENPITTEDLDALGMAEDYLRVASNVSTTLEALIARRKGCICSQIISFGSLVMPIVAVAITTSKTVHCYTGDAEAPLPATALELIKLMGGSVEFHAGTPQTHDDGLVLRIENEIVTASGENYPESDCAGVVTPNVLHITDAAKIDYLEIEIIRKRMSTPITSPVALDMMQKLASNANVSATWTAADGDDMWAADDETSLPTFYEHLQSMTGAPVDMSARPYAYTAGLPAIAAIWFALARAGGAELIMCSTCYGGSSQLTDLLTERCPDQLRKHTFGVQGDADIVKALKGALDMVNGLPLEAEAQRKKKTVLFIECPTNPNMKVPDMDALADMIESYVNAAGAGRCMDDFLLMIDATFAPGSKVMEKLEKRLPALPMMVFISMSKSVSRGMTTGGALIANGNAFARSLLADAGAIGKSLDTTFKLDQGQFLVDNHTGVEERCFSAHGIASQIGETLRKSVAEVAAGFDMPLAFVLPEHAEMGFTSSTFSFNLPKPEGATEEETEAFAQKFVTELTTNKQFKPCVSFGQDNGLIYCTVPATSTQGCIKPEDKALQAVGGVQLVRLSFPPTMDIDNAVAHVAASVAAAYGK